MSGGELHRAFCVIIVANDLHWIDRLHSSSPQGDEWRVFIRGFFLVSFVATGNSVFFNDMWMEVDNGYLYGWVYLIQGVGQCVILTLALGEQVLNTVVWGMIPKVLLRAGGVIAVVWLGIEKVFPADPGYMGLYKHSLLLSYALDMVIGMAPWACLVLRRDGWLRSNQMRSRGMIRMLLSIAAMRSVNLARPNLTRSIVFTALEILIRAKTWVEYRQRETAP